MSIQADVKLPPLAQQLRNAIVSLLDDGEFDLARIDALIDLAQTAKKIVALEIKNGNGGQREAEEPTLSTSSVAAHYGTTIFGGRPGPTAVFGPAVNAYDMLAEAHQAITGIPISRDTYGDIRSAAIDAVIDRDSEAADDTILNALGFSTNDD